TGDGRGRSSRVWKQDGGLFSYLSVDTFSGIEPLETPQVYPVDVTQWSLVDGALVPAPVGEQCVDHASTDPMTYDGLPVPCPEGYGTGGSSTLLPDQEDVIGPGESFAVSEGSEGFTVSLDGSELVVVLPGGEERRVPLSGGGDPMVYTTPVNLAGGDLNVLVAQEGGDSSKMTLVTLRQGRVTATLTEGPVPFGNGWLGPDFDRSFRTWIGPEGVLYTRVQTEPGAEEYDVYRWSLGGTVSMGATPTLQPLLVRQGSRV
ncbi:MAG: hypothetical protein WC642_04800, partial [Nocardioides sp.]